MSRPLRMFLRFCCFCLATSALAQGLEFYPGVKYDAATLPLKQVVGQHWGGRADHDLFDLNCDWLATWHAGSVRSQS